MVKHTQTIRRLLPMNCLSVFDHFVRFAFKGLTHCEICQKLIKAKNGYNNLSLVALFPYYTPLQAPESEIFHAIPANIYLHF